MGSIKKRILVYFCTSVAIIILAILLAVHITLQGGIDKQFVSIVQDIKAREVQRLDTYQRFLNKHIGYIGREIVSATVDISANKDLSENIEFVQLSVLSHNDFQTKTETIIEKFAFSASMETANANNGGQEDQEESQNFEETGKIDFAIVMDLQGDILAAYPKNANPQVLAPYCKKWNLPLLARDKAGMTEARLLPGEFLSAMGLTNRGRKYEQGTATLVCANIIRDEFENIKAFLLTGKLFDRLGYNLQSFFEATGAPAVIYLGNKPVCSAGIMTQNSQADLSGLVLDDKTMEELGNKGLKEAVELKLAGNDFFAKAVPIVSGEGERLGLAVAGLPMEQIRSLEASLATHGLTMTQNVARWIAGIGILAMGAFILLSLLIAEDIASPVRRIALMVRDMAEGAGDLTIRLQEGRRDELADLARWFNIFMEKLQAMVLDIKKGSEILAVSSSQISTTAAELASSSAQTSSSISQISTTMEQVKQTATLTSEKAEQVSHAAQYVARNSETGERATQEAVQGMNRIKEEMEFIAESIVKLSEQTQSIGDIIDAVGDLANESNLLSVNASIEAAKAGEYGKGFSVVAHEVKNLSDQSKQATAQVRTILNDIQGATSTAVMATERGSKAVDAGVGLSDQSGDTIRALVGSVNESSQAAAQIAASNHQQLVGMDQLSKAMMSIKDASLQNVEGAKQLEYAITDMHELGQQMKELAGKFKV
ncbi:MAG: methyl-accepting chemotaxis protein [Desulfatibacillum sp.]|nr:methyl-accepting chemotaxis protein [Desulfatibacillum sp.]